MAILNGHSQPHKTRMSLGLLQVVRDEPWEWVMSAKGIVVV